MSFIEKNVGKCIMYIGFNNYWGIEFAIGNDVSYIKFAIDIRILCFCFGLWIERTYQEVKK
jgi:hypothetical protein